MTRKLLWLALLLGALSPTYGEAKKGRHFFVDYFIVLLNAGEQKATADFAALMQVAPRKSDLVADWWKSEALEAHEEEISLIVEKAVAKIPRGQSQLDKKKEEEMHKEVSILLRAYYTEHLDEIMKMVSKMLAKAEAEAAR